MGPNVDNQALLVRKSLAASGADVWPVRAVGATMLGQHTLREEVGATLADKRSIAGVLADVLRQVHFLAERSVANGARERLDAEMAHLVRRQLHLPDERFSARAARERPLAGVELVVHPERQRRREMLAADVAQERLIVGIAADDARRHHDDTRLRAVGRFLQMRVEFGQTETLPMARRTLHDGASRLVDVPRRHVLIQIRTTAERRSAQVTVVLVYTADVHLLVPHETLLACKLAITGLTLVHIDGCRVHLHLSRKHHFAGCGGWRDDDEFWIFFSSGDRNEHAALVLLHLCHVVIHVIILVFVANLVVRLKVTEVIVRLDGGSRLVAIQLDVTGCYLSLIHI